MENRIMNENAANQNLKNRETWKTRIALPVLLVLLTLGLGAAALNQVIPNVAARPQGFASRAGWYFRSGPLQADLRTLGAAVRYLLEPESANSAGAPVSSGGAAQS